MLTRGLSRSIKLMKQLEISLDNIFESNAHLRVGKIRNCSIRFLVVQIIFVWFNKCCPWCFVYRIKRSVPGNNSYLTSQINPFCWKTRYTISNKVVEHSHDAANRFLSISKRQFTFLTYFPTIRPFQTKT